MAYLVKALHILAFWLFPIFITWHTVTAFRHTWRTAIMLMKNSEILVEILL